MGVATFETNKATQVATHQRDTAISGGLVSDSEAIGDTNATVSNLERIAAWGVDQSAQARYALVSAGASPEIATFTGGSGPVDTVAFSPDGKTLVTGDNDGTIRLWDAATGRQIRSLPNSAEEPAAFSPDGKTLATGDLSGPPALWNIATGQQIRSFSTGNGDEDWVGSMAFSRDGAMLATGDEYDSTIRLWDVATGRQIRSFPTGRPSSA